MAFEAKDYNVGELFNKVVFSIPRNQRRYVWTENNWQELLEDIYFSCNKKSKAHFMGSMVFENSGKKNGLTFYKVIDGQQRLMTITIVLLTIMKLFNEREMTNEFLGTIDYVMTKDNLNKPVPMLSSEYHMSLEKLIKETVGLKADNKIGMPAFVNVNIIDKKKDENICNAFKFYYKAFSQKIKAEENENEMLLKIRNAVINMVLVSIVSSTEEDAYTIFEILNARGQELEDYELLKNYIMRYIEPDEYRDSAKIKWETIENKLGNSLKKFISHYAWHKYGVQGKEKESAYRIIQKNSKGGNINQLLDDIMLKADYYSKFVDPNLENCTDYEYKIFSFFKNKRQEQFKPLILSLMHQKELGKLSESYYEQTLKFIYNFFVCYTIIGEEKSNKLRDLVIKYAVILENEYNDDTLLEFGKSLKGKIPSYNWFEKCFENLGWSNHTEIFKGQKNKQRVQITLEIIEKFVSQRENIDEFTVEHILPDSEGEQNAHIGNMIPLESKLNEKCENKALSEKYIFYLESNFSTARNLVGRYKEKEFIPQERTRFLARLVYNNILELNQLQFNV